METTKEDYRLKMEAQLNEWGARLDVVKAKLDKASLETKGEIKTELHEQVDKLKALQASGREQLKKVEAVAATTWDEAKTEMIDTWNQVSGAAEAIWKKIS
jgi:hypothetical protein